MLHSPSMLCHPDLLRSDQYLSLQHGASASLLHAQNHLSRASGLQRKHLTSVLAPCQQWPNHWLMLSHKLVVPTLLVSCSVAFVLVPRKPKSPPRQKPSSRAVSPVGHRDGDGKVGRDRSYRSSRDDAPRDRDYRCSSSTPCVCDTCVRIC